MKINIPKTPSARVRHIKGILSAIVIAFVAIPVILQISASAYEYSNKTQTTWVGGVGVTDELMDKYSAISNLDGSTAGELNFGATPTLNSADWCNSTDCDDSFLYRKLITVNNTSDPATDANVTIDISYDSKMLANFQDIRFVALDSEVEGETVKGADLGYYFYEIIDSDSAKAIVKVPNLPTGKTSFYMYFGNDIATSNSHATDINLSFADGFNSGVFGPQWSYVPGAIISNGEAKIADGGAISSSFSGSRGNITTVDTRVKISFINPDCSLYSKAFTIEGIYMASNFTGNYCDNLGQNYIIASYFNGNYFPNGYYERTDPKFYSDTYYDFRVVYHKDSGVTYWYKKSTEQTYSLFYNMAIGDSTITPQLSFYNGNSSRGSDYFTTDMYISSVNMYVLNNDTASTAGITQYQDGATGNLTSTIFDAGAKGFFGIAEIDTTGTGINQIQIRSSDSETMTGATDWDECNLINSGSDIYSSTCVTRGQRYYQYRLNSSGTSALDLTTLSVNFKYANDLVAPITNASNIVIKSAVDGRTVADQGWLNTSKPYISWDEATDDVDGSGIAGYCLYVGTTFDQTLQNLATTSGLLMGQTSPIDTNGMCQYATPETHIDLSTLDFIPANNGDQINIIVVAFDESLNIYPTTAYASYMLDTTSPSGFSFFTGRGGVSNSKSITVNWLYAPGLGVEFDDEDSGIQGAKYCLYDGFSGVDSQVCDPAIHPENFYGPDMAAYNTPEYMTDVYDVTAGRLTTNPNDPRFASASITKDTSLFMVYTVVMDKAGNFLSPENNGVIAAVSQIPSGKPKSLTVDPINGETNDFSFSWAPPAVSDNPFFDPGGEFIFTLLEGLRSEMSYCWSVNVPINAEGTNCTRTAKGVTELPADAYATLQGKNTMYIMSINEAGNFITEVIDDEGHVINNVAEIDFYADTLSPGVPQNIDVIDVSTRATSTWRLALSWTEPTSGAGNIANYRIWRSINDVDWTEVGRTSKDNLSFIDSNLQKITYYYRIEACDNANSCGARGDAINVASIDKGHNIIPTGRYTEPAKLTADSDQPRVKDIGTKKATVYWFTDRESDSKVSFSDTASKITYSGSIPNLFPNEVEIGSGLQVSDHSINLTNLQPNTVYYYQTKWTDQDGNTGYSEQKSFTTLPAPVVSEVSTDKITISGGTINLTVEDTNKLNIYYGKTEFFGGALSINTSAEKSAYSIALTDLDDGTKYYFKLNGFDSDGNEYQGNVYSFATLARPKISNLRFQPVVGASSNTTIVTWTTNVPTSSELSYGIVGGAQLEAIDSKLVVDHSVTISGLADDKDYTLTARSRDALGNLALSDVQAFKTALDTRPPKISNIMVESSVKGSGAEARGQIVISWTTDELATSQVAYGQGTPGNYTNKTSEDNRPSLEHVVIVSDLATSSIFQVQPISNDKASNEATGTNQSAIIGRGTENVFTIIFNSLRNIFGIKG